MAQHLQAFCMLLATHRHHIVTVPSSLSNCRHPIAILELPSLLLLLYYIDESIIVVTMVACADGVLLFPQPTEHVTHHRCCRQPQQPQSGIGHSSLPSQHKADCYVKRGQIVGNLLKGSLLLSLHHSRSAAASCLSPSLLCQIPQPVPPPFNTLLCPTCSIGYRVARWPPSASQPVPPPLFTPLHLLVVALLCVTLSGALAFPPPLIMPLPLVAPLLFGWLSRRVAWCTGLSPPPIAMLEMLLLSSSTSLPLVAAAASSLLLLPSPLLSPPSLSLQLDGTLSWSMQQSAKIVTCRAAILTMMGAHCDGQKYVWGEGGRGGGAQSGATQWMGHYHRPCPHENKIYFTVCTQYLSGGALSKKLARLEHHPGDLWCSNVARINNSIAGGFGNCPMVLPILGPLWSALRGLQNQKLARQDFGCAVLPYHHPFFWFLGESVPAGIFWKKNWWELLGWLPYWEGEVTWRVCFLDEVQIQIRWCCKEQHVHCRWGRCLLGLRTMAHVHHQVDNGCKSQNSMDWCRCSGEGSFHTGEGGFHQSRHGE